MYNQSRVLEFAFSMHVRSDFSSAIHHDMHLLYIKDNVDGVIQQYKY
jgi:hypothetical protein